MTFPFGQCGNYLGKHGIGMHSWDRCSFHQNVFFKRDYNHAKWPFSLAMLKVVSLRNFFLGVVETLFVKALIYLYIKDLNL
jgi:hypothetical protein